MTRDHPRAPAREATPPAQALRVGPARDPWEHEADRVADAVVAGRTAPPPLPVSRPVAQRACACGGAEERCDGCVQRAATTGAVDGGPAPAAVHAVVASAGSPLDPGVRRAVEPLMGADLSSVRVHTDGAAAESARQVNALAYTVGEHVVFGAGHYSPNQPDGLRVVAHELAHVLQQRGSAPHWVRRQAAPAPAAPAQAAPAPATPAVPAPDAMERLVRELATACAAFAPGGTGLAGCGTSPKPCGQRWLTAMRTALAASDPALPGRADIVANENTELAAEIAALDAWFDNGLPGDRGGRPAEYAERLRRLCALKSEEIRIQFRFGSTFSGLALFAPQQSGVNQARPWAQSVDDWRAVENALAAIPPEHLRDRATGARVTFVRQNVEGSSTGQPVTGVGATTSPSNVVTLFDSGASGSGYGRTSGIPNQPTKVEHTLRHELGHVVESGLNAPGGLILDMADLIGWHSYTFTNPQPNAPMPGDCPTSDWTPPTAMRPPPAAGTTPPPALVVTEPMNRRQLCTHLGVAEANCDVALSGFLVDIFNRTLRANGRCFSHWKNQINSWPAGRIPNGDPWRYARTSRSDFFAETYTFATSAPQWLHQQLPTDIADWFKRYVFNTSTHRQRALDALRAYNSDPAMLAPLVRLRSQANVLFTGPQFDRLLEEARVIQERTRFERDGAALG